MYLQLMIKLEKIIYSIVKKIEFVREEGVNGRETKEQISQYNKK